MHAFIKKNQKLIMVFFSVGLTIAFALPSAVTSLSKNRDVSIARMGKTKVSQKDVAEFRAQWELLKRTISSKQTDPSSGQERIVPFLTEFFAKDFGRAGGQFAEQMIAQIDANPELFYVLYSEAEQLGTVVTIDEVQSVWKNYDHLEDNLGGYDERAQEAIRTLLLIGHAADRAGNIVKVSRPQRDHDLANQQEISVNLVEFKARDYLTKIPAWTDQDKETKVKAQYEQYKNQEPTTRPGNESGFGYRVPNQVRVQYIELPSAAIRKAVVAQITDIDARKYFYQNIREFPAQFGAKPPVGIAATQPTSPPRLSKVFSDRPPTTGPTLTAPKHFESYRDEITQRLTDERITKLSQEILTEINAQMGADYLAFKAVVSPAGAGPSTAPSIPAATLAKAPKTTLGDTTYDSYEYLHHLANHIQAKFGILPTTHEDNGLRTIKQLSDGNEIAKTAVENFDLLSLYRLTNNIQLAQQLSQQIGPLINFPVFTTTFVAPFANDQVRQFARNSRLRVLDLYEPSPIMRDKAGDFAMRPIASNSYIFRVCEALPAHAPALAEVREQVIADARLADAYKLAADDANAFLKSALEKKVHLQSAALEAGKTLTTTGLFDQRATDIENYPLVAGDTTQIFVNAAYALLNRGNPDVPHPMGVAEFRPTATVLVAELNQIKPRWTPETLASHQVYTTANVDRQIGMQMRARWFSPQDIMSRTHYVPLEPPRKPTGRPAQDQPPINPIGAALY